MNRSIAAHKSVGVPHRVTAIVIAQLPAMIHSPAAISFDQGQRAAFAYCAPIGDGDSEIEQASGCNFPRPKLRYDPDDGLPRLSRTPTGHEKPRPGDDLLTDAERDSLWVKQPHHRHRWW
jgi:hypothetical protein